MTTSGTGAPCRAFSVVVFGGGPGGALRGGAHQRVGQATWFSELFGQNAQPVETWRRLADDLQASTAGSCELPKSLLQGLPRSDFTDGVSGTHDDPAHEPDHGAVDGKFCNRRSLGARVIIFALGSVDAVFDCLSGDRRGCQSGAAACDGDRPKPDLRADLLSCVLPTACASALWPFSIGRRTLLMRAWGLASEVLSLFDAAALVASHLGIRAEGPCPSCVRVGGEYLIGGDALA